MDVLRTLTLTAHGVRCAFAAEAWPQVPDGNAARLSAMQRGLLSDTPWVRVVDAPTGSGKSYAFQKAVLPRPGAPEADNVLFIAPTRRLTEALSRSLVDGLVKEVREKADGVPEDAIQTHVRRAVLVWNGAQEAAEGLTKMETRLNEINAMPGNRTLPELGKTVFTVLEVVRDLLFPTRLLKGRTDEVARHFLARFRHVVFDEFHTLGEDGVALALVVVALARQMNREAEQRERDGGFAEPRILVSFLSATPVDLAAFLEQGLGKPFARLDARDTGEGLCVLQEELVHADEPAWSEQADAVRPIHGNVRVSVVATGRDEGLDALARACIDDIVEEIRVRRQVVFIFDSKGDAMRRMDAIAFLIAEACRAAGLPRPAIGVVNASDDRARRPDGSDTVPLDEADVLLATASVEAGVTFRGNRLLFMEPGTTVLNFVQRLGRCARGADAGQVWVRTTDSPGSDYRDWWAALATALTRPDGGFAERMRVDAFLAQVRAATTQDLSRSCLASEPEERGDRRQERLAPRLDGGFYATDALGRRAWFKAAFFWGAVWRILEQRGVLREGERYMGFPPRLVLMARALLKRADALRGKRQRKWLGQTGSGARQRTMTKQFQETAFYAWLAGWREGLLALRDIGPPVWVIDHDAGRPRARPFERGWLWRWTDAFQEGEPATLEQAHGLQLDGFRKDDDLVLIRGQRSLTILTAEEQRARHRRHGAHCPTFQSPWHTAGVRAEKAPALRIVSQELDALAQALRSPDIDAPKEAHTVAQLARWVPLIGVARRQEGPLDDDAAQWGDLVL